MQLELDTLLPHLIDRGLVDPAEVVDDGLTLQEISRRNANFRVERDGRQGYLIKQAADSLDSARTLDAEAAVCAFFRRDPRGERLREMLPALTRYEPSEGLLVFELVSGARPLWEIVCDHEPTRPEIGPLIGRALGLLHASVCARELTDDPLLRTLCHHPPWVLWVHKPGPELLATITSGASHLLRVIQDQRELGLGLEQLRREWRSEVLVHGDIRADNILVASDRSGYSRIVLVDWELAHFGDPAWDVGSAFADWIHQWVCSMPAGRELSSAEMAERAAFPLHHVQGIVGGLWIGYVRAVGLEGDAEQYMLLRSIRYCSARLLQRAYESANNMPILPNHAVLLLQVAANVLAEPQAAAAELLGIPDIA
jgi:tRNA A-37 threonylcarbamoyl transferase component Bud32